MGLKINRQRDESFKDNRNILSPAGKKIVIGGILIVVALVVVLVISLVSGREERKYKDVILNAVARSITVSRNSVAELQRDVNENLKDIVDSYIQDIENQKKIMAKTELAKELITYLLGYSQYNVAVQDDLKGAQNRIMNAVKEYQTKYGTKSI